MKQPFDPRPLPPVLPIPDSYSLAELNAWVQRDREAGYWHTVAGKRVEWEQDRPLLGCPLLASFTPEGTPGWISSVFLTVLAVGLGCVLLWGMCCLWGVL